MADNSLQFEWIAKLKGALEFVFRDRADVFVAGDLLWYPVEGNAQERKAPDALVAFGRPKGHRSSYKQWEEGGVAPQVVFEVMSPSNTLQEMLAKHSFYETYGVDEFYVLDPEHARFWVWNRGEEGYVDFLHPEQQWHSQRLGIRILVNGEGLEIYFPNGERILSYSDTRAMFEEARVEKEAALQREQDALAEIERLKAELKKRS